LGSPAAPWHKSIGVARRERRKVMRETGGGIVMSATSKTVSVTAADGGVFNAYLALPEGGRGPALVLLQEIFGVNRYLREVADRYAEEGYVTIAPDLFWRIQPGIELGYSEAEIKAAFDLFARFDPDQAIKDVADTVRALRAMPECNGKVGAVGF